MNSQDRFDSLIQYWSEVYRLNPAIIKNQIRAESSFQKRVVSSHKAMGLMQLMPETAKEMELHYPFDPDDNIRAGCRYMRRCYDWVEEEIESWSPQVAVVDPLDMYRFTLSAYNAGIGYVWAALRALRPGLPELSWDGFRGSFPHVKVRGKGPRWRDVFEYVERILPSAPGASTLDSP